MNKLVVLLILCTRALLVIAQTENSASFLLGNSRTWLGTICKKDKECVVRAPYRDKDKASCNTTDFRCHDSDDDQRGIPLPPLHLPAVTTDTSASKEDPSSNPSKSGTPTPYWWELTTPEPRFRYIGTPCRWTCECEIRAITQDIAQETYPYCNEGKCVDDSISVSTYMTSKTPPTTNQPRTKTPEWFGKSCNQNSDCGSSSQNETVGYCVSFFSTVKKCRICDEFDQEESDDEGSTTPVPTNPFRWIGTPCEKSTDCKQMAGINNRSFQPFCSLQDKKCRNFDPSR